MSEKRRYCLFVIFIHHRVVRRVILSSINYKDNISLYKHIIDFETRNPFCRRIVYYHNEDNYNIRVTS